MNKPPFISWRSELLSVIILGLISVASAYLSNVLPDVVVTHWDFFGKPNGYSSRTFVVLFFPILALGLYLLMLSIWTLDPKRERYQEFKVAYHSVKTLFLVFIAVIYALVALSALGYEVNMSISMSIIVGLFFIGIGFYLPQVKQNWMFGVRTPWTLGSEPVWDKTHRLAGKTFIIGGVMLLGGSFFPGGGLAVFLIVGIIFAILVPVIYSYTLFSRERR